MKKSEIVEGCCYKLAPVIENLDFIKKEIDSGHLLKNKGRPYMVVFCNKEDSTIWVAPLLCLSSRKCIKGARKSA